MNGETIRLVLISTLVGVALLWLVASVVFRVSGTWERQLSTSEREAGATPERITLGQLGPLVTGRREVPGGYQELSGICIGPIVRLTRRDHGVKSLVLMGFPEPIAKKLDGEVTAQLDLRVRSGLFLEGTFTPQKFEFTHQPPRVTKSYPLAAQPRKYRRLDAIAVPVEEPASVA